jgi:organic radical activating enzyme
VIDYWSRRGWLRYLTDAFRAHLVLTGGEPLLWQRQLNGLLELLAADRPFVEVETNATLRPCEAFDVFVSQYNCSPKLTSAGNPQVRAFRPEALGFFAAEPRAVFKFVVQKPEADLHEILDCYVEGLGIAPDRVWLMPEAATRERLIERSAAVMEMVKRFGFRFSSRLHLIAWDQTTGV